MIDSHAHLSSASFREVVDEVVGRAKSAGLVRILNIATDPEELDHALQLSQRYPWIQVSGATTPHDVEKEGESAFAAFERAARAGQLAAIGETGLDYYYEHSNRALQQEFLRRYLRLAKECHLPLIIHCREAFSDLFEIFTEEYGEQWLPGILHCFTGTEEEAKVLVEKGWMISLSGIVTFKKSEGLRNVAKTVPLEQLLVETDAPYLAPQSKRGQQNEPAFVVETARLLAEIKGLSIDQFNAVMGHNLKKIGL